MPRKKVEKFKTTLSSMQAVTYNRDFKMADRAGGFTDRKGKKYRLKIFLPFAQNKIWSCFLHILFY